MAVQTKKLAIKAIMPISYNYNLIHLS